MKFPVRVAQWVEEGRYPRPVRRFFAKRVDAPHAGLLLSSEMRRKDLEKVVASLTEVFTGSVWEPDWYVNEEVGHAHADGVVVRLELHWDEFQNWCNMLVELGVLSEDEVPSPQFVPPSQGGSPWA